MNLQRIWPCLAASCFGLGTFASVVHAAPDPPAPPSAVPTPAPKATPSKTKNTAVPISSLTGAIAKVIKSAASNTSDSGAQISDVNISCTIDPQTTKSLLESASFDLTVHAKDKASADHLIQHEMNRDIAGLHKNIPGQKFTVTNLKSTVETSTKGNKSMTVTEERTFDLVPRNVP